MADTLRTETDLLTNLFQDGQSGGISAQDMRDLIVSVQHQNKHGFFDYNDSSGTTITLPEGVETKLNNDGLGIYSNKAYPPNGVTDVWNSTNNQFDFSELTIGTMVELRVTIYATTLSNNTDLNINLVAGIGGNEYTIPFHQAYLKYAGPHEVVAYIGFYIGGTNMKDNPAEIRVTAEKDASVVVGGWYTSIIVR